ncbi:MAG TPA: DNA polymerase III subunit delta' [Clostridia bacterium]|nr:DNA polymerase III subunit delta' [Clostridia bacterium]
MDFSGIIGQKEVVGSLERALSENRVGHAYIFTGPAGMGKKTIAHLFAGLLLCDAPHDGKTCDRCMPCRLFKNGSNPDFHRIDTEEASIGVDKIRDVLADVAIKPVYSKRKVYIVEDAEKMTEQAQNCLLKTFEEPPEYVVIILLTANYEALLETVRSRAQHLHFRKYTRDQVRQALALKVENDDELSKLAVDYSDGSIGLALELACSGDFSRLRDRTLAMLPGAEKGKTASILEFTAFIEENRESVGLLLDILLLYYRDLLVMCETGNENMLINSDKKDMILNNAQTHSSRGIVGKIDALEATRRALKQNANLQLAVDNLLISLREDS